MFFFLKLFSLFFNLISYQLELIFVYDIQLLQQHSLKRLSLLLSTAFAPLSKIIWLYLCESISGFSIQFY